MQTARSAVFTIYLVGMTIVYAIVLAPTIVMTRAAALWAVKFWARSALGGLKAICGAGYDLVGAENIPRGGALVAAKHQSAWETIALVALLPDPAVILKKELMAIPIYGWWAAKVGMIPIDRTAGASALRKMTAAARQAVEDGRQIIIFPEGTRVPPGESQPYKPGVVALYRALNTPVVPVGHNSGLYWMHPGILRKPGDIRVEFKPAIPAGLDKTALLDRLRHAIEDASSGGAKTGPAPATTAEQTAHTGG